MTSKEIWNIGGITQSGYFADVKHIDERIVHSGVVFELYDSYPGTCWNGGRPTSTDPDYAFEDFVRQVELLNKRGIGFNFTFSNLLLEERHLDDERGNYLLERFNNGQNGAIVGSSVLAKHIRSEYPKYRLINTLTHYHRDLDYYRRAQDLYDVFVLPPSLNHRFDFIAELGPERVEILVNESCHSNCPFSKEHYNTISEYNLSLGKNPYLEVQLQDFCEKHHSERLWSMSVEQLRKSLIGTRLSPSEVDEFKDLGVSRFKLSARTKIGVVHQSIYHDIRAFIFDRMKASGTQDPAHLIESIIHWGPRSFQALR